MDPRGEVLYEFLTGPHWSRSACTGVCNRIAGAGFPSPGMWNWHQLYGQYKNVADLVWPLTTNRQYVEAKYPLLRFLVNNKIGNVRWEALTLTTLTLFDVLAQIEKEIGRR